MYADFSIELGCDDPALEYHGVPNDPSDWCGRLIGKRAVRDRSLGLWAYFGSSK
jgi:hypothetical protein